MPRPIITLTTDFGLADSYVAQMKGAILRINPDVQLVDVTHEVPPQQIARGAAILAEIAESFPAGAIHLAVIDPGVGSSRSLVAAEIGNARYIAPDNGLLSEVSRRHPPRRVVRLENHHYWNTTVSTTFHGRDIMAPVAAHWSLGCDATDFGPLYPGPLVMLPDHPCLLDGDLLRGEVLWCDRFGNLITSILESQIPSIGKDQVLVECAGRKASGIHERYSQVSQGSVLALIGSAGRLEIAVRDGNAQAVLNCREGTEVTVRMSGREIATSQGGSAAK